MEEQRGWKILYLVGKIYVVVKLWSEGKGT